MKIFYIGKFAKIWDEKQISISLEQLGHEVFEQDENESEERIRKNVISFKPDVVLFAKLQIRNALPFLQWLKRSGYKTVSWTFDLYFNYVREDKVKYYPFIKADYVFTTDGGHDDKFREAGINHQLLRQGIFQDQAIMMPSEKEYDVVFVGCENLNYPYRQEMMAYIEKYYPIKWFGRYNTDEVRGLKLNELYGKSKIVIGDSVPSPYYWSNRLYETIGRGGFTIFPYIKGIDSEFTLGKHFVTYEHGNLKDLQEKIEYYLKNDEEREKIRKAGFEHCKRHHTYKKRCEQLIKTINNRVLERTSKCL